MRGFTEQLATKQDYFNSLKMFPEQTKKALKTLLANRFVWVETKELTSKDKGKEDKTHRVIAQVIIDEKTGEKKEIFIQLEEKEDPNARIFMLGFSIEEVQGLIAL